MVCLHHQKKGSYNCSLTDSEIRRAELEIVKHLQAHSFRSLNGLLQGFGKIQVGNDQEKAQSEERFPLQKPN